MRLSPADSYGLMGLPVTLPLLDATVSTRSASGRATRFVKCLAGGGSLSARSAGQ